jgi:putative protease
MSQVELLAPAGSFAALNAAVCAGADAVYLGLEAFNARRNADNFTLETLAQACDYAHLRGVKVYVTLNIEILPNEINDAIESARQAWLAGADGFIVQDIGVAAELSRVLPQARLHISTQMNIHDEDGVRAVAALGAKRITLARELSLAEISNLAAVAAELGVEIEVFAHGAICVCYSGQCLMSSMIGGRSANRGLCAQACRLPYELEVSAPDKKTLKTPGEHLLSPKDLCTADSVSQLISAGVASLKIEGRMKSPEYVQSVVSVYRRLVDASLSELGLLQFTQGSPSDTFGTSKPTQDERNQLDSVFSRGFTQAYLDGKCDNSMMSFQRPNNRGQFIGRVKSVKGGVAKIQCEQALEPGDIIEFWTKRGRCALTIAPGVMQSANVAAVELDDKCAKVGQADRLFRVRSAKAAFKENTNNPRVVVDGQVDLRIGSPAQAQFKVSNVEGVTSARGLEFAPASLAAACRLAEAHPQENLCAQAQGSAVEPARSKEISSDDVRAHVDRLGSTPYVLNKLDVKLDGGVGMGFSTLHHLRQDALNNLTDEILQAYHARKLDKSSRHEYLPENKSAQCEISVLATNPQCARAAKRAGAGTVYVPALNYRRGQAQLAGQLVRDVSQAGFPKHCAVELPSVGRDLIAGTDEAQFGVDVWEYCTADRLVLAQNFGDLCRLVQNGIQAEAGPSIPVTNKLTLDILARLGASRAWLSPELNIRQIESLASASPLPLGFKIFGAQELMVTQHCVLANQGQCAKTCDTCPRRKVSHQLKDRKGYEFPVVSDALGKSHIYNSVQLDAVPALPELISAGVSSFMVDTTLMNAEQTAQAVSRAVHALEDALAGKQPPKKLPNTTSGHLFRGIL